MKKFLNYPFILMSLGFSFVYSGGENNRESIIEKLMHDYNYVCQVNYELKNEIASLGNDNNKLALEVAKLRRDFFGLKELNDSLLCRLKKATKKKGEESARL